MYLKLLILTLFPEFFLIIEIQFPVRPCGEARQKPFFSLCETSVAFPNCVFFLLKIS